MKTVNAAFKRFMLIDENNVLDIVEFALLGCIACTECKDAAYCYRCSMVCMFVCVCWTQP